MAILGEPSFLTAVSVLSVLLSEAVYIPIEPSWPLKRIKKILKHSGADTVLSSSAVLKKHSLDFKSFAVPYFFDLNPENNSHLSHTDQLKNTSLDWKADLKNVKKYYYSKLKKTHSLQANDVSWTLPKKTNSSIAYIMYTSGSTGEPKGVKVSLMALHKFLNWIKEEFQISSKDRFSYTASLGFGGLYKTAFFPHSFWLTNALFSAGNSQIPFGFFKGVKTKANHFA